MGDQGGYPAPVRVRHSCSLAPLLLLCSSEAGPPWFLILTFRSDQTKLDVTERNGTERRQSSIGQLFPEMRPAFRVDKREKKALLDG
jgi:hypothetical protein